MRLWHMPESIQESKKEELKMNELEYMKIWGNGNPCAGFKLFEAVTKRLEYAREKHPDFTDDKHNGYNAVKAELEELKEAILYETEEREFDEALDVIVTALRFANREYNL